MPSVWDRVFFCISFYVVLVLLCVFVYFILNLFVFLGVGGGGGGLVFPITTHCLGASLPEHPNGLMGCYQQGRSD